MAADGLPDPDGAVQWVNHQRSGIGFEAPLDWAIGSGGSDVVVALEPPRTHSGPPEASAFRANLVLTVTDSGPLTFTRWQAATDRALPVLLRDYALIDLEHVEVAGGRGGRRLARHLRGDGLRLVMQQWCCLNDHHAITLTSTTDLSSHALLLATMRRAAESLRLPQTAPTR